MKINVSAKELDLITKALGFYFNKKGLTDTEINQTDDLLFDLRQLLYVTDEE